MGGTHPALIEAMGQGNIVIANGTEENVELLPGAGLIYQKNDLDDLVRCLQTVADRPQDCEMYKAAAIERARTQYSWDAVIQQYEQLFARLKSRRNALGTPASRRQK